MVSPYKYLPTWWSHINIRRNTEHSQADVVPACQVTLKNLQLDYVDLYLVSAVSVCIYLSVSFLSSHLCVYLYICTYCVHVSCVHLCVCVCNHFYTIFPQIHWPQALPRGVTFAEFTDEHYLGYSEERIADTWKVSNKWLPLIFCTMFGIIHCRVWRSVLIRD